MPLTAEDRRWLDGLTGTGERLERTCRELHAILLRAARSEMMRQPGSIRVQGPDSDDTACQAASDALLLVLRKATEFRGDSRFTTWATRFVVFELKAKLRQHASRHRDLQLQAGHYDALACPAPGPAAEAGANELAEPIQLTATTQFNVRQQTVFWGLVSGVTTGVLGRQLSMNANAVYQVMFKARRRLRTELLAQGFLELSHAVECSLAG